MVGNIYVTRIEIMSYLCIYVNNWWNLLLFIFIIVGMSHSSEFDYIFVFVSKVNAYEI